MVTGMGTPSLQLELPLARAERTIDELREMLCRHGGQSVELTLTRNRVSLVSVRFSATGTPRVRLSQAFLSAPDEVVAALGQYLAKRSRAAWRVVATFVRSRAPEPRPSCDSTLPTQGRVYDLVAIRDRINQLYFGRRLQCRIGWGRTGQARRHARSRSIRYGSYSKTENLVRIHPALDDVSVPADFVDYIVFHEMLHAAVPSEPGTRRWLHHHDTYRRMERRFPDLPRMQALAADLAKRLR